MDHGLWGLTHDELAAAVTAADPAAFLVPPRILRRVIKQHRVLDDVLRVPHRKTYFIRRDNLLEIVELSELGLEHNATLPEIVILLPSPEIEQLAAMTRPRALVKYWRLLFHARVHVELEKLVAQGRLTLDNARERIARIGTLDFEEIRAVLKQEEMLLPPADDLSTYIEFVAVYLELRHFAPRLLPDYFPSVANWEAVQKIVTGDIHGSHWFAATRLTGSPDPDERPVDDEESLGERREQTNWVHPQKQSERAYCRLMERADRARTRGNDVRSAMYRWRAALTIGPKLARTARDAARADLDHLAKRLTEALELPETEQAVWSSLLHELLSGAASGVWTAEARLLYDLQKVCIDHERGVYALDTVRWLMSKCSEPLRRPLPSQRDVLMSKHLVAAMHRLSTVRLPGRVRDRLSSMLRAAKEHAEGRLRDSFRPRIESALNDVGLVGANPPEDIARRKLIEELLDRVVERGFLSMADLRDGISRNQLKLGDVENARELWRGDQLLRADRQLGRSLDGVYRPGEMYLRWPQSLSSLGFGTRWGRWITRYVALPYGGAFMALEFVQYVLHHITSIADQKHLVLRTTPAIAVLGTLFLLLYYPTFRRGISDMLHGLFQLFYQPLVAVPLRLLRSPLVQKLLQSPWFRRVFRYVVKPLMLAMLIAAAVSLLRGKILSWETMVGLFFGANLLLNSRWGRTVDELVTDWAARSWNKFRIRVLAAAMHAILDFFHQVLETIERFLYTVDEWLRFRTGDSQLATYVKAILGVVWFFVNYVIRFCVTLLIEPQINPVKHFPVVTVSHKVILPLGPYFVNLLAPYLGVAEANAVVWSTIWLVPGVFGFLIWELKENWRLYSANRSPVLRPVPVGHHGESIVRLLRPGFHSGTVPKLYQRLRRADRKALATGHWTGPRRYVDQLHEVREAVWRFADRDLISLLQLSESWRDAGLHVHDVRLGLNNLRLSIAGPSPYVEPLWITLQEKAGWLTVRMRRPAWFENLSAEQSHALNTALAGWFKMSGVELIHEQIETSFEPYAVDYELCEDGLLVTPRGSSEPAVVYPLRDDGRGGPLVSPSAPSPLPTLDRQKLVFASAPIRWETWVETWQREVGPLLAAGLAPASNVADPSALPMVTTPTGTSPAAN